MNPNNLVVHIRTMDEAYEVVDWFESLGFHREALTPDAYLEYPYLHIGDVDRKLLTGASIPRKGNYVHMEYPEWKESVELEDIEIEDDAFDKILNSN